MPPADPTLELRWRIDRVHAAVEGAAGRVRNLCLICLSCGLYLAIVFGATTHEQLVRADPVVLPLLNVELPLLAFYWVAPALFVLLHLGVLAQCCLLAEKHDRLEAEIRALGDERLERLERARLDILPFAQMLADAGRPRARRLATLMAWLAIVVVPVLVLLLGQASFLPYHDPLTTWWHRVLLLLDLALLWWLWPMVTERRARAAAMRRWPAALGAITALASAGGLLVLTIPGERLAWPLDRLAGEQGALGIVTRNLHVPSANLVDFWPGDSTPGTRPLDLRGRDLRYGDFDRSSLMGADLRGADLRGADLGRANLRRARLAGADLRYARLRRADLYNAELRQADLREASLGQAKLERANLANADLRGATLTSANMSDAWLRNAKLEGAHLLFADLQRSDLQSADLRNANLASAKLRGAHLAGASLQLANLAAADLRGVDLSLGKLEAAKLWYADLQGASLRSARLVGATLRGANLRGADLWRAYLQGADLRDTDLRGASLSRARLWRSLLGDTNGGNGLWHLADLRSIRLEPVDAASVVLAELEAMISDGTAVEAVRARLHAASDAADEAEPLKKELAWAPPKVMFGIDDPLPQKLGWREPAWDSLAAYDRDLARFLGELACAERSAALLEGLGRRAIQSAAADPTRSFPGLFVQRVIASDCPAAETLSQDMRGRLLSVVQEPGATSAGEVD